ncbi:MAG: FIST N-terminal domain-containing protein [Bacteroidia bacterium]
MIIEQLVWTAEKGMTKLKASGKDSFNPQLVLVFGAGFLISDESRIQEIVSLFPNAQLIGCSTSGEIAGNAVFDNSLVISALQFEKTELKFVETHLDDTTQSYEAAKKLVSDLSLNGLKHLFVLSDGLLVNGTELVSGLRDMLPSNVHVTGGLAGDGASFEKTYVLNNSSAESNRIIGIGFYGENLKVGFGSFGGWDSFGIERRVTKSIGNVLYEIDDKPALSLYKSFLGDKADELPASGLLFPLSIRTQADSLSVVRTILAINEQDQSITFAGDLPEGAYVKLMKANVDRLISGAEKAAMNCLLNADNHNPEFAILISCVGRKLVLKQMVEEEVEAANHILGKNTIQSGFYSYGEISPFSSESKCELHNQTMTITTFKEV